MSIFLLKSFIALGQLSLSCQEEERKKKEKKNLQYTVFTSYHLTSLSIQHLAAQWPHSTSFTNLFSNSSALTPGPHLHSQPTHPLSPPLARSTSTPSSSPQDKVGKARFIFTLTYSGDFVLKLFTLRLFLLLYNVILALLRIAVVECFNFAMKLKK